MDVQFSRENACKPFNVTVTTLTGGPVFPVFPGFPSVPGIPGEPGGPWEENRGASVRDETHLKVLNISV